MELRTLIRTGLNLQNIENTWHPSSCTGLVYMLLSRGLHWTLLGLVVYVCPAWKTQSTILVMMYDDAAPIFRPGSRREIWVDF
jgi:hypothetical protein